VLIESRGDRQRVGGKHILLAINISSMIRNMTLHQLTVRMKSQRKRAPQMINRVKGFSRTGEQSIVETKCLAEQNGGAYIPVETEDELASALRRRWAAQ